MATGPSSTVLRWDLARRLRELRLSAELTIEDVAKELMCSPAKVSRMETAGRGIQPRDVRDLCRFYNVSATVRDELMAMARDARRPGWWNDYRVLDEQTKTYLGLESACSNITFLEARVVPGLLQTEAYARLLLGGILHGKVTPELIDELIETRTRRAERVTRGEVQLAVVVDEAALSRGFGHPEVMADQLGRVTEMAALANVEVRVTPLQAPAHPGLSTSFALLSFADRSVTDLAYVESMLGHTFIDRPEHVKTYVAAYQAASSHSLEPEDSLKWLQQKHTQFLHNQTT